MAGTSINNSSAHSELFDSLIDFGDETNLAQMKPAEAQNVTVLPRTPSKGRFARAGPNAGVAAPVTYSTPAPSVRSNSSTQGGTAGQASVVSDFHIGSDSEDEKKAMKKLSAAVGHSYYAPVAFESWDRAASGATADFAFAQDTDAKSLPQQEGSFETAVASGSFFDEGVPAGAAIRAAQLHLEKAEEDAHMRDAKQREDNRSEQLRGPIVMKTRGNDESERVITDPYIAGFFSTRKPRHAGAGLVSGIKSITKGVALGAASLVVCPVVGGHQNGMTGFVKGMGAGVLGAVALPVTGVGVAGYQIGRGVVSTPNAIYQRSNGKKWDKRHCEWRDNWYSLEEEAKEVMGAVHRQAETVRDRARTAQSAGREGMKSVKVADTEFYDILGVSPSATQPEIKRQYYKLAKEYHPDKTGDAKSAEKFMKLGEAYQVIGDEERRRMYDMHGKAVCDEMPILDSSLFFMVLFGSDDFEPYVGKLRMALYMELELDNSGYAPTSNDFEVAQWDREVKLALTLRDLVRPYVCGDLENWYAELLHKAKSLCTNSFSVELVETIGWTYRNVANRYIGKWDTFMGIGGKVAKFQEQSKSFGKSVKAFTSMIKTAVAERSVNRSRGDAGESENLLNEQYMKDVCEHSLPAIMDAMLNICLMDVQSTVKEAAKRIVRDMAVDEHWRRKRAEGLGLMGRAFMLAAEDGRRRLDQENKPMNMYDMFAQAAEKVHNKNNNTSRAHVYRTDDGFY
ncbi:DnaJ protein, putative [Babesia caballi]|uniref:DnaJ protein, putative n=1 Tax=Babesia caballi TaxID=5871 RepID=A0AAV4LPE6_BABCB|nr:DnaJ protein, putative [Babesia caballi]